MMIRMVGGWVFLLVRACPGSHGQRAVKRSLLFLVAVSFVIWSQCWCCLQRDAVVMVLCVCVCLCRILEYLVKSDVLNCQHSLTDLMSTSLAQKASLWHFYGHRSVIRPLYVTSMDACLSQGLSVALLWTQVCHMASVWLFYGHRSVTRPLYGTSIDTGLSQDLCMALLWTQVC